MVDDPCLILWKDVYKKVRLVPVYEKGVPTRWREPRKGERGFIKWIKK